MRGTYGLGTGTNADADGWFNGVWVSRELRIAGGVRGVWGKGPNNEGGFLPRRVGSTL
jgi:hypothetical protein